MSIDTSWVVEGAQVAEQWWPPIARTTPLELAR